MTGYCWPGKYDCARPNGRLHLKICFTGGDEVVPAGTPNPIFFKSSLTQAPRDIMKQYPAYPEMTVDVTKNYTATIETTAGTMVVELFASEAPLTVNNFVFLARDGFYNDVIFHRVIPGFMIQGGDPSGTGRGGPGYKFNNENSNRRYLRGTLAMANAGRNTNGSQFFVMHKDYPLPPDYTIFGKLVSGEEALDAIANAERNGQDRPFAPTTITSITISES